jgi:hypothetical protein
VSEGRVDNATKVRAIPVSIETSEAWAAELEAEPWNRDAGAVWICIQLTCSRLACPSARRGLIVARKIQEVSTTYHGKERTVSGSSLHLLSRSTASSPVRGQVMDAGLSRAPGGRQWRESRPRQRLRASTKHQAGERSAGENWAERAALEQSDHKRCPHLARMGSAPKSVRVLVLHPGLKSTPRGRCHRESRPRMAVRHGTCSGFGKLPVRNNIV